MATPQQHPGVALTAEDQLLIEKTEIAIRDGIQLERWCRDCDFEKKWKLFPLDLRKTYRLVNTAHGFFDVLPISGVDTSVMGCVQVVEYGKLPTANAVDRLTDYVCATFLPKANWKYDDGFPGGFGLEQSIYKKSGGGYGKFSGDQMTGCVDWRCFGQDYDWVLLTVRIHDFVMKFGPWIKRFDEAACVVPNKDFVHIADSPRPGIAREIAIGYPFVGVAPIPNNFGFGPGKFGTAVKTYSFVITDKKELKCRMYFAAAPRCAKVFDFGKSVPDPVYGGAALLRRLTFGLYNDQPFHDKLDSFMLGQHSRVHQSLMDGSAKNWDAFCGT